MLLRSLRGLLISGAFARSLGLSESVCPCCGTALNFRPLCRSVSTTSEGSDREEQPEKPSPDASQPVTEDAKIKVGKKISDLYLSSSNISLNTLVKTHRHSLVVARTAPAELYVIFESLAESIVKHMNLEPDASTVYMEGNPGLGVVTKAAFDKGLAKIRVFEGNPVFLPRLEALQNAMGYDKLEVLCPFNPFSYRQRSLLRAKAERQIGLTSLYPLLPETKADAIPSHLSVIKLPTETFDERTERLISAGLSRFEWKDDSPALKFFGIVPDKSSMIFIKRILKCVAHRNLFCRVGRPEFYLIVTNKQHDVLVARPPTSKLQDYRYISVAAQTFYDIQTLEDVPRTRIVPPPAKNSKSTAMWKLVKLSARKDIDEILGWDLLPEYSFFIRQAMMQRSRPLLAWLEAWIPGSPMRFLDLGYTMYQRTGDITYSQYIEIFKVIYNSPEYISSNLKMAFFKSSDHLDFEIDDIEEDEEEDKHIVRA